MTTATDRLLGSILIVVDEPSVRHSLSSWFKKDGHSVATAENSTAALRSLRDRAFDVGRRGQRHRSDVLAGRGAGDGKVARIEWFDPGAANVELPAVMFHGRSVRCHRECVDECG